LALGNLFAANLPITELIIINIGVNSNCPYFLLASVRSLASVAIPRGE